MSLSDDVRAELHALAKAYIRETYSISDILTLEVEYCDLELEIDEELRSQLASLSLRGNEYLFGWGRLEDFEEVIFRVLGKQPDEPPIAARREAQVLATACLDHITTLDSLIKFERRHRTQDLLPAHLREQLATIAERAREVENQERPRAEVDRQLRRLLSDPSAATAEAAGG